MKNIVLLIIILPITLVFSTQLFLQPTFAQFTICSFLPCPDQDTPDPLDPLPQTTDNPAGVFESLVRWGVSFIFSGIIIYGIIIIIKASIKIIQSEGNPEAIENSQKAISSVFFGIGIIVIGIIGIIVITALFEYGLIFNTSIQAPSGINQLPFVTQ